MTEKPLPTAEEITVSYFEVLDFTQDGVELQLNEKIARFLGGVIVVNPLMGEQWVFDKPGTPEYEMKCPPFGCVSRKNQYGWTTNWNWIMWVLEECREKAVTDNLKNCFDRMVEEIRIITKMFTAYHILMLVNEFINIYNREANTSQTEISK